MYLYLYLGKLTWGVLGRGKVKLREVREGGGSATSHRRPSASGGAPVNNPLCPVLNVRCLCVELRLNLQLNLYLNLYLTLYLNFYLNLHFSS